MEIARRSRPFGSRRGSDRSPLHDVRQRTRGDGIASARNEFSQRTSFADAALGLHRRRPRGSKSGGARRDRTDDLLLAKQALSQLSYGPDRDQIPEIRFQYVELVGLGRFELPTSRLSSARSNQLSYKPGSDIGCRMTEIRTRPDIRHLSSDI